MSRIQVKDLTFSYDGSYETVFDHVSFQIDTDWRLGFTGRNGRGKTTFLKLLMGQLPYRGTISASVGFSYFPYDVPEGELTVAEAIGAMDPEYEFWRVLREMNELDLPEGLLERSYHTLSGGEKTKLQLAVLFARENQFLLIDEPTNHLDLPGRQAVSRYLLGKRGFILVSHDRAFLDGCVDHILSINRADITVTRGNFSTWWENKARQDAFELAQDQKLRREISRLEETAREKAVWSDRHEATKAGAYDKGFIGAEAARMMKRSKTIQARRTAAIEEKSRLLKNLDRTVDLKIFQEPWNKGNLASFREVAIAFEGRRICRDITFSVEPGDRIAIQGPNGSGKSSLLRLLQGEDIPHTGQVRLGAGLKISVVNQDSSWLRGNFQQFAKSRDIEPALLTAILAQLDVGRSQLERDLGSLSAGQKKKILLAASLCQRVHLHIWDEPMNYIDLLSRIQIEELLNRYRPTIVFVEHDRVFCENIATKRISLGPGD